MLLIILNILKLVVQKKSLEYPLLVRLWSKVMQNYVLY